MNCSVYLALIEVDEWILLLHTIDLTTTEWSELKERIRNKKKEKSLYFFMLSSYPVYVSQQTSIDSLFFAEEFERKWPTDVSFRTFNADSELEGKQGIRKTEYESLSLSKLGMLSSRITLLVGVRGERL